MKEKTNIEKMIGQTIHDVDPKAAIVPKIIPVNHLGGAINPSHI